MKAKELAEYLDELLKVKEIPDSSLNGLQVENEGEIKKIGTAVDISEKVVAEAIKREINFLIVHHGLFWGNRMVPLKGSYYLRIKALMKGNIALYAAHLPLDMHEEFGNNAVVLKELGWPDKGAIGEYHGVQIGRYTEFEEPRNLSELIEELNGFYKTSPILWNFGGTKSKKVAVISGLAVSLVENIADKGVDFLVTGETSHSYYWIARERGINVAFYGHYITEKVGVQALGKHLSEKFGFSFEFIDLPTGY